MSPRDLQQFGQVFADLLLDPATAREASETLGELLPKAKIAGPWRPAENDPTQVWRPMLWTGLPNDPRVAVVFRYNRFQYGWQAVVEGDRWARVGTSRSAGGALLQAEQALRELGWGVLWPTKQQWFSWERAPAESWERTSSAPGGFAATGVLSAVRHMVEDPELGGFALGRWLDTRDEVIWEAYLPEVLTGPIATGAAKTPEEAEAAVEAVLTERGWSAL